MGQPVNGNQALQIFANFDTGSPNGTTIVKGASITVTIFFSKPVSGLLFSFWDVDASVDGSNNPYTDLISNLHGQVGLNGASVAPFSIINGAANPTSTTAPNGAANTSNIAATTASITGTGSAIQGAGTPGTGVFNASSGRSTVQFGNTPIDRFSFTYTDPAAAGCAGWPDLPENLPGEAEGASNGGRVLFFCFSELTDAPELGVTRVDLCVRQRP